MTKKPLARQSERRGRHPEDHEQTVEQARRETDAGFEPELASTVRDLAPYETVYLGFPIWGTTAPPVIRSFLSAHDLSGKDVVPFITHGGYPMTLDKMLDRLPDVA